MNSESQNIEYKESWNDKYLEWICGFANAQGGKIYIGINDAKQVVGFKDSKRLMEDIPNKIVSNLGIVADVNLLEDSVKEYVEIVVQPSPMPISYYGKYHYRSGSTKQELNGASLQQFILKKMGRSWDEYPRDTVTLDAIDRNAIDYFIEKGIASGRIDTDERNATTEQVLENLNLIDENDYLKNAAQDVVKDVVKEIEAELSERQSSIIALLTLNPTITIPEMSGKMSGKKHITTRTIERDIAYLQNHDIIKREGGRKEGRWVVLRK